MSASAPKQITLISPAKINLFLHVTGKRADGYHLLITLMCCLELHDKVSLSFGRSKISVSCNDPAVPENKTNLAYRAADLFFQKAKISEGVGIAIDKRIPVAAGLGGGSSNAAAVLLGLNHYYDSPFSDDALAAMALSLGADVPFFIFGKPAVATGIGEIIEPYDGLAPLSVVLIYPGFGVSTADIYKNVNLGLTKCKKKFSLFSFKNRDFDIERHICNDLEPIAAAKHSEILMAKEALLAQGAAAGLMSGSGPTVFGLFFDPNKAQKAKQIISQNSKWRLFLTNLVV